jgi:hypothetical protein
LKPFFWVKILKFFDADPGRKKIASGMEKSQIRDGKKSDPGWKKGETRMEKFRSGMEKRRIREGKKADPGWKKVRSGIRKNILDREKHPESATLVLYFMYCRTFQGFGSGSALI